MSAPTAPPALRRHAGNLIETVASAAERLAFWASVALPCVHLPVLALYGLGPDTTPLLVALWSLHAATLLAGRRHRTGRPAGPDDGGDRRDGPGGDDDGTDHLGAGD